MTSAKKIGDVVEVLDRTARTRPECFMCLIL